MRYFILILALLTLNSCDYFSFKRKNDFKEINPELDTTSVDIPPSLGRCNALIDKQKKTVCFNKEMHKAFAQSLQKQKIVVKNEVEDTVVVTLRIHSDGKVELQKLEASKEIYVEIPNLKKIIEQSISDLPKVVAAVKKEVPVTTEYTLPIKISLKN